MENGTSDDVTEVLRDHDGWPTGLRAIEVEPTRLWLRGRRAVLDSPRRVAIVGSRAPTPYGVSQAERFGFELASAGLCVVSGLARGVDSAAHTGALRAGGATIGVLGCGVDRPWPAGPLADRMVREGLLLSEYAPGTAPRRHHFPMRNRIIAGLSDAVVVIEAARASGSLITARWAADQGQDVFALPGRVDHPMARGTLDLIREGATPVESPAMLLQDLYGGQQGELLATEPGPIAAANPLEESILSALQGETMPASEVASAIARGLHDTLSALSSMEVRGLLRRAPGGLYHLARST
ncbi:MAG: DNA-processing protein DprA [Planctomycetota bacterium]